MTRDLPVNYIRDNFEPTDRLAVVLINKSASRVVQRLADARNIAAPDFQRWLRDQNARHHEIYLSMNTLKPEATGRRKEDVDLIRHLYLDFDEDGTSRVQALMERGDLPAANYLVNTSPDKWQVVWKVEGFSKNEAEQLLRGLARASGADPAATDCSRVLRLPGFHNHKYATPYLIRMESMAKETYRSEQFPRMTILGPLQGRPKRHEEGKIRDGLSQSEHDWAYAKRALARGDLPSSVIAAIAAHRRLDKRNPHDYAERTVRKAREVLQADASRDGAERR